MHATELKMIATMMLGSLVLGGVQILANEPLAGRGAPSSLTQDAAKRYAAIKPRPEEVKWRKIPWLVDLSKAIQIAREEKRPLLIWTGQQSHPLERC